MRIRRLGFGTWPSLRVHRAAEMPRILFIHVPKTAGTSMRQMLQVSLGERAVYPSNRDIARRADGCYPSHAEILRALPSVRPYRVLIGHFVAGLARDLPVRHRTATMLRDPVQRSLSMLAHVERHRGISPEAVLDSEELCAELITDHQTRLLGADAPRDFNNLTGASLNRALRTVAALDYVGITERFGESCRLFDAAFGTDVSSCRMQANVLRPGGRGLEEFIPRIEPLVTRDRVLYESACARFERELAAITSSPEAVGLRRAA